MKNKKKKNSLTAYLLISFAVLLLVAILVTWVFQVGLLNEIFKVVKKQELKSAEKELVKVLGKEEQNEVAAKQAQQGQMCIEIYQIYNKVSYKIFAVDHTNSDKEADTFLPTEKMEELYQLAKDNDGFYQTEMFFGGRVVQADLVDRLFSPDEKEVKSRNQDREMYNLVQVSIRTDESGNNYLILMRSPSIPFISTSSTLRRQFIWIAFILLLAALFISIPLSKRIAKPLRKMNEQAKLLAKGNYNVHFSGSGYRETEDLAASLDFAASELAKTDQLQKELIANISHDLRTPLTMIRGYGEAMRDIPGENTPENVQVIIDEAEHLSELVNDLLDLSRIQAGVRAPIMEEFDFTQVLKEVMERYEIFTKNKGYTILLHAESPVKVFADRGMILQVLYNLINNAINYAGEKKRVEVFQTVREGKVRLDVVDFGEGIEPDKIPYIWDRYYKVDKVHQIAKVGTGLGLSIVKTVLESHKAAYGVESRVGKGSDFWFELPLFSSGMKSEH